MRIISLLVMLFLTGCYPVPVHTNYNRSLTSADSESDRIFLSFRETKHALFSFILISKNEHGEKKDFIKLRWKNPDRYQSQFNGMNTTLKFMINNEEIITIKPIKNPVFVSYNIEDKTSEEEGLFEISRAELERLAYAKDVKVELSGKYRIVNAHFNKWSTFRAFKNFVKST